MSRKLKETLVNVQYNKLQPESLRNFWSGKVVPAIYASKYSDFNIIIEGVIKEKEDEACDTKVSNDDQREE